MNHTVDVELSAYDTISAKNGVFTIIETDSILHTMIQGIVDLHNRVLVLEGEEVELIGADKNG